MQQSPAAGTSPRSLSSINHQDHDDEDDSDDDDLDDHDDDHDDICKGWPVSVCLFVCLLSCPS